MKRWLKGKKYKSLLVAACLWVWLLLVVLNQQAHPLGHQIVKAAKAAKADVVAVTAPIPEPSTYAMVGIGIIGLIAVGRHNKRKPAA